MIQTEGVWYTAMAGVDELVGAGRDAILRIARTYGARRVRVFGSVARGEAREDSDLDLLVDLEPGRSLLDLVAIKQDLEDLLGREVDVVTEAGVSPYISSAGSRPFWPVSARQTSSPRLNRAAFPLGLWLLAPGSSCAGAGPSQAGRAR